jgi:hypothetical protein
MMMLTQAKGGPTENRVTERRNEGNVIPSERVLRGERAGLWLEWRSAQRCDEAVPSLETLAPEVSSASFSANWKPTTNPVHAQT